MSISSPSRLMPSPYRISVTTCLNGGASLFLTTLILVWLPMTSSPFLIAPMRDVQAHRGVELQRIAAGSHFRALPRHHHADLHAQLVDEHHRGVGALDVAGQLAQCLAHQ